MKKNVYLFVMLFSMFIMLPFNVNASKISPEFQKILNEDGKFVVNSVQPKNEFEAGTILFEYSLIDKGFTDFDINVFDGCNETYTSCEITYKGEETHVVEIVYNYDRAVKSMIDEYISRIPANKTEFEVRDLEIINFWVNGQGNKKYITNYSGELKEYFDYKNFRLDARRGTGNNPLVTGRGGIANFKHNDTIYGLINGFDVNANHILYVADETANTPLAIQAAAQKRINDYLGHENVKVVYISTARDYWSHAMYEDTKSEWSQVNPNMTFEEFKNSGYYSDNGNFTQAFYEYYGIRNINENDYIYSIDIPIDENRGDSYTAIIKRDSSKMVTPNYITTDASTNITISSIDTEIPLDTMISAERLTSGSEYERIVNLLNLTDNLTFDLKLYSDSLEKYVTQLSDGTFEVRIPIPEDFKGKDLVIYYVGVSGTPELFKVEIENDYAVFNTNHFSIYTLGYRSTAYRVIFDSNEGFFKDNKKLFTINEWKIGDEKTLEKPTREGYEFIGFFTEKIGGTSLESYIAEAGIDRDLTFYAQWKKADTSSTKEEIPPKTYDGIGISFLIEVVSLIGIGCTTIYLKKQDKARI